MRSKFDEQLLQLNHEMIEMGALCEAGRTDKRTIACTCSVPSPRCANW